jgi:hypothetical protein
MMSCRREGPGRRGGTAFFKPRRKTREGCRRRNRWRTTFYEIGLFLLWPCDEHGIFRKMGLGYALGSVWTVTGLGQGICGCILGYEGHLYPRNGLR